MMVVIHLGLEVRTGHVSEGEMGQREMEEGKEKEAPREKHLREVLEGG